MKRACVIGDSHVAALKKGWETIKPRFAGLEISFFAAPGNDMRDLAVSGTALEADTGELKSYLTKRFGTARIEGNFDAYLLCGMGLSAYGAMKVGRSYRGEASKTDKRRAPISDECFVLSIMDGLRDCTMQATLAKLRSITDAPVWTIAIPFRSASGKPAAAGAPYRAPDNDHVLASAYHRACSELALLFRAEYLPQPAETVGENALTTKADYATMPERLHSRDAPDDCNHMNAAYGAIVLENVLRSMIRKSGGTAIKHLRDPVPPVMSETGTGDKAMTGKKAAATTAKQAPKQGGQRKEVEAGSEMSDLAALIAGINKVVGHLQSVASAANGSIHITDWLLLRCLAEGDNLPLAQVARRIGVSRQRVHQQVESLKGADLVETADAGAKNKTVAINAAGRALVQTMEKELSKALTAIEGKMPTTELHGAKRSIARLGKAIVPKPEGKSEVEA